MKRKWLPGITVLTVSLPGAAATPGASPPSATVPVLLDRNRMTVEVELRRTDGSARPARAWVDSGGTSLIMAEPYSGIDPGRHQTA
jgi:hypothetical protein